MDNELLGLPATTGTALALIATGVIVPAVTSLISYEGLPTKVKRFLPVILAAGGAGIIVGLQSGGAFAERLTTWLVVLATIVGIAQALYATMPTAWKALERATDPSKTDDPELSDAEPGQERTNTPEPVSESTEEIPEPGSGLERPEESAPFRQYEERTIGIHRDDEEDGPLRPPS